MQGVAPDNSEITMSHTSAFLDQGSETGRLIKHVDWGSTSLGSIDSWPRSLKMVVGSIILSSVPIVTMWGTDGIMIYNDAYSEFAGGRHPQLLGSKVREGWPEVADFNDNVMKVGLAGGTLAYKNQKLTLSRHGHPEPVWMNLDYSPILNESGKPSGVVAIVVETTDRVIAEQRLAAEKERLIQLFDQGPSCMALLEGPEHRYALANASYLGLIERTDVIGKTVAEVLPEAIGQGYVEILNEVFASAKPFTATSYRFASQPRPGGPISDRYFDFTYQPIKDSDGKVTGIFFDGVDATARTLTEAALRASEAELREVNASLERRVAERTAELQEKEVRLRTIFETAYQFQGLLTLEGDLIEANKSSLEAIKSRLEDVAGMPFWETPWFADTPGMPEMIRQAIPRIAQGEAFRQELVVNLPESADRAFDFAMRPIRDAAGNITAILTEAAELTERRRAEEALRQSQKMEAVGQLTGGLAHDFNNLLTGILGSLEIMENRLAQGKTKELERYITVAQGAGKRAAALTHRLLAFSRRQTLDPKPTDINRLLPEVGELIQRTVGPGITVEIVAAIGLWMTMVDPNQLENALLNLCINGRDAMPDGGRLTIETGNKWLDERAARDRDLDPGQYVSVCVSDTGRGMADDVIARAFDPFFTTKPLGQGTGLGLSMVYGFARQSGGQVRIYSEIGNGSLVCLYLPRLHGSAGETNDVLEPIPVEPANDGETVLIVDDEPAVRLVVVEVLTGLGYRAIEAEDGATAMKVLRTDARVDLLITDIGLPGGTNGRQLADLALVARPSLKVLFITGYAENAVIGSGLVMPGMHVLTKPFAMETLARRIKSIIGE